MPRWCCCPHGIPSNKSLFLPSFVAFRVFFCFFPWRRSIGRRALHMCLTDRTPEWLTQHGSHHGCSDTPHIAHESCLCSLYICRARFGPPTRGLYSQHLHPEADRLDDVAAVWMEIKWSCKVLMNVGPFLCLLFVCIHRRVSWEFHLKLNFAIQCSKCSHSVHLFVFKVWNVGAPVCTLGTLRGIMDSSRGTVFSPSVFPKHWGRKQQLGDVL